MLIYLRSINQRFAEKKSVMFTSADFRFPPSEFSDMAYIILTVLSGKYGDIVDRVDFSV